MAVRRALGIGMLVASALVGCSSDRSADGQSTGPVSAGCASDSDLRLVFYGAAMEEGGDVFGLTAQGEVRQMTTDQGSYDPSFSPDGSQVVFTSIGQTGAVSDGLGPSGLHLHVIEADGSDRRRLTDGDDDVQPAWAPEGDRIAFVRRGGPDAGRIFVVDPDDAGSARVLVEGDPSEDDRDPAWSPDGRTLAFVRSIEREDQVVEQRLTLADADGGDLRTLLTGDHLSTPSWSPDGTELVVTRGDDGGRSSGSAVVVEVEDGSTTAVIDGPVRAAVWAATGRLYAFARSPAVDDVSGHWRVAEFEPDGDGGFATGRPIGEVEPVDWLYGDHGIDVLRCDGPDADALTSDADVPDRVSVTDPVTGGQVAVMTREQATVVFETQWASVEPPATMPTAKLVHLDDLGDLGDLSGLGEHPDQPENGLVWAVADPSETRPGFTQLSVYGAVSGRWIRTGPIDPGLWLGLTDLAP